MIVILRLSVGVADPGFIRLRLLLDKLERGLELDSKEVLSLGRLVLEYIPTSSAPRHVHVEWERAVAYCVANFPEASA